jgi:type 1 fimbria pilin
MKKQLFLTIVVLAVTTTAAMAGTQATNTNTVAPTLQVQVNVQKAVRLTLSTGTAAVTHCAVAAGANPPDYTMNFGTVDALGINAGNCNQFAPATPGVSNAIYWSDYNVTPMFTSQSTTNNTVTAQVTTDFAAPHNVFVVRDSANSAAVPASAAAMADTIATNAASGTALTRYIGVAVTPANGATVLTGNQTATVTFTLTVQ